MSGLRDRLLLIVSAVGLMALSLGGIFIADALHLGEHWSLFWPYTVLIFLALLVTSLGEIRRRKRKLRHKERLLGVMLLFFLVHLVGVGWLLSRFEQEWRMPHFYMLSIGEVILFGLVFEKAYAWSTAGNSAPRWPTESGGSRSTM